jgi:CHAT domain-containing protein
MMSLWKVPDAVTCMLIEQFYTEALAGRAIDAALREAQLFVRTLTAREFLARWADDPAIAAAALALRMPAGETETSYPFVHEAFWGGFVCVGDMSPLSTRPGWAMSR